MHTVSSAQTLYKCLRVPKAATKPPCQKATYSTGPKTLKFYNFLKAISIFFSRLDSQPTVSNFLQRDLGWASFSWFSAHSTCLSPNPGVGQPNTLLTQKCEKKWEIPRDWKPLDIVSPLAITQRTSLTTTATAMKNLIPISLAWCTVSQPKCYLSVSNNSSFPFFCLFSGLSEP